jgi:cell wall-associated NlpC family hydrolase
MKVGVEHLKRGIIVEVARSMIDTPWRHQGRVPGKALDCTGLIVKVGHLAHVLSEEVDYTRYNRYPDPDDLRRHLAKFAVRKRWEDRKVGDIIEFAVEHVNFPCHLGILTEKEGVPYLIHAQMMRRKVVEHEFSEDWVKQATKVFKYPGV